MELRIDKKERVWVTNPILQKRPLLSKPIDGGTDDQLDDLLRFVFYFADPEHSPLLNERDFEVRRSRACELGGLKKNLIGETCRSLGDLEGYTEKTSWLHDVLSEYLRMCNSTMFEAWVSMKINMHQVAALLRSPLGKDQDASAVKRVDLQSSLLKSAKEILEIESIIFSGVKEISDAVSDAQLDKALASYAERYADSLDD